MSLRFDLTVAAIAEDHGRFLLVQERAARRLVLNQPAGHVEHGESLLEAVIRETREETGRDFTPQSVTGIYLWQGLSGRTFLRIAIAGRAAERSPGAALDRAILRTLWLDRQELAARAAEHRSPLVMTCIDDYLSGIRHPLELLRHITPGGLASMSAAG
jgi:8-oxo-dGTP pyrophosphatase MutT (NUDIX family)